VVVLGCDKRGDTFKRRVITIVERKGRMTDRERVEALLRREKPDLVPIYPWQHSARYAKTWAGYLFPT
jgi:hypothetical protein